MLSFIKQLGLISFGAFLTPWAVGMCGVISLMFGYVNPITMKLAVIVFWYITAFQFDLAEAWTNVDNHWDMGSAT